MSDYVNNTPAEETEIDNAALLEFFDTKEDLTNLQDPFAAVPEGSYFAKFKGVTLKRHDTEKGSSVTANLSWLITEIDKLKTPVEDTEALIGRTVTSSVNSKMVGVAKDMWLAIAKAWMGGTVDEIKSQSVTPKNVITFLMTPDAEGTRTAKIKVSHRIVKPKDGTDARTYTEVKDIDCDIVNGARISDVI